ncbi:hypothetical protein [Myxosarcina sp. GI1]|uniref:hypothetical protein n=1 Tax=Myxosarcina sp. GI1 TaxID=1541065 RepID=UPI00056AC155|nr:hypothetical protein [Myxosarcina sp. GI1]
MENELILKEILTLLKEQQQQLVQIQKQNQELIQNALNDFIQKLTKLLQEKNSSDLDELMKELIAKMESLQNAIENFQMPSSQEEE